MRKRPYFECLLLDFDGTLADSSRLVAAAVKHATKQAGKRVPQTSEILERHRAYGSPRKLLKSYGVQDDEAFWDYYTKHLSKLRLFDRRLRSKLKVLRAAGIRLGIVTSLPAKGVKPALEHLSLTKYLEVVKTAQWMTKKSKLIDLALREMGVSFRGDSVLPVLYLGDTESDVKAAKRAAKGSRIWSAVALWNGQKTSEFNDAEPDFFFSNFGAVLDTVASPLSDIEDFFAPSLNCYTPHPAYLTTNKIQRSSCYDCFFPTDCLNCARFEEMTRIRLSKQELKSLSKVIGVPTQAAEQFYPLQVHTKDHEMKDVRRIVGAFKRGENYRKFRLGLSVAIRLRQLSLESSKFRGIDLILPVPTTKKKFRVRGYNPPAEIAKVVGKAIGVPVVENCLSTTAKKSRKQTRHTNTWDDDMERIAGNVHVRNKGVLAGKKVLLMDDILTRGVTLAAYAKAIRESVKPKPQVVAMTFGLSKVERNFS